MRLRTVNSIILPSAHKVKASARNSVTTVVGGGEMLRGTLERVPRTPQNFSQILYWRGWGGGAERGLAPGGGCAPARHLFALPLWGGACPNAALARPATVENSMGGLPPRGTCYPCPGGEDHLKRRSSSPPVPPLLGCRHCSPVPRPNRNAPAGCRQRRGKAPLRAPAWQGYKCRVGSGVGMQGAEPLA